MQGTRLTKAVPLPMQRNSQILPYIWDAKLIIAACMWQLLAILKTALKHRTPGLLMP